MNQIEKMALLLEEAIKLTKNKKEKELLKEALDVLLVDLSMNPWREAAKKNTIKNR
jgi:hypothetical protein